MSRPESDSREALSPKGQEINEEIAKAKRFIAEQQKIVLEQQERLTARIDGLSGESRKQFWSSVGLTLIVLGLFGVASYTNMKELVRSMVTSYATPEKLDYLLQNAVRSVAQDRLDVLIKTEVANSTSSIPGLVKARVDSATSNTQSLVQQSVRVYTEGLNRSMNEMVSFFSTSATAQAGDYSAYLALERMATSGGAFAEAAKNQQKMIALDCNRFSVKPSDVHQIRKEVDGQRVENYQAPFTEAFRGLVERDTPDEVYVNLFYRLFDADPEFIIPLALQEMARAKYTFTRVALGTLIRNAIDRYDINYMDFPAIIKAGEDYSKRETATRATTKTQ
ncbi:MAG: hypothetical protein NTW86_05830 [Candidatus Sumerlaeota bacterium]|nr:hypothetical protein [Candidatus Sumerlaeota bacterium]